MPDGLVETWQANAHGKYAHPEDDQYKSLEAGFKGYGRVMTDDQGKFQFATIKPGSVPAPDGKTQAPHIAVSVFARGLERRLVTRLSLIHIYRLLGTAVAVHSLTVRKP